MKTLADLENVSSLHKLLILGYGRENRQFIDWLLNVLKISSDVLVIADQNETTELEQLHSGIELVVGQKYLTVLEREDIDYVVKAPGIWSLLPELQAFRDRVGQGRVMSSLVFFIQKFRDQIIGVTGTKGKSTTANLITHLLQQQDDINAVYCGNTSNISPYTFWKSLDQDIDSKQYFVMELSSFQLQDLSYSQISPRAAVIANYYLDHQDQHASPEEYWKSKDALFLHQKPGDVLIYNTQIRSQSQSAIPDTAIGLELTEDNREVIKTYTNLYGEHNHMNALLATNLVAQLLDLGYAHVAKDLQTFSTLDHRLQKISSMNVSQEIKGRQKVIQVNMYDDGYATEPHAVEAAAKTLSADPGELLWLWIAGVDKGPDLNSLAEFLQNALAAGKVFSIEYCGEVGKRLRGMVEEKDAEGTARRQLRTSLPHKIVDRKQLQEFITTQLNEHVLKFPEVIDASSIVINIVLSPGGSSFDEFTNATERAEWWTRYMRRLTGDKN
jgi:UDP-N-acetylmuramoylalanine-D-glutamate ligase